MNISFNKKIMIVGNVIIAVMLLSGCDSAQTMKNYYLANRDSLIELRSLSKTTADNNDFEQITVMKKDGKLELMFLGGTVNNVTMYLNSSNLNLISENPVSRIDPVELQRFRTISQSTDLRHVLQLFNLLNPKAIKITHGAIFIALGKTLKHPNIHELKGGILMTFQPGVPDINIVEEIEPNVYLYDALIY